jgi:CsoR family transcriptional regulator, copper-sensing transcriptional repressor
MSTTSESCPKSFPDHSAQLTRLNRVAGQVAGVHKMIEDKRYCADILTQLRAVRAAVKSIEANILEVYLGSCVADALQSGDAAARKTKIAEVTDLFKRYEAND